MQVLKQEHRENRSLQRKDEHYNKIMDKMEVLGNIGHTRLRREFVQFVEAVVSGR